MQEMLLKAAAIAGARRSKGNGASLLNSTMGKEKIMYPKMLRICMLATVMLMMLLPGTNAYSAAPKAAKQPHEAAKVELHISADGKALVDQNGQEIARFVEGTRMQAMAGKSQKLQGCMRCWKECLIYDGERCVQWIRTCQWDFDCK